MRRIIAGSATIRLRSDYSCIVIGDEQERGSREGRSDRQIFGRIAPAEDPRQCCDDDAVNDRRKSNVSVAYSTQTIRDDPLCEQAPVASTWSLHSSV